MPLAFGALLALSASAQAQSATYGFENLLEGQTTPLVDVAPDSGDLTFRASFSSLRQFTVGNDASEENPAFMGHYFVSAGGGAGQALTITFNKPVNSLRVDEIQNVLITQPAGRFEAVTSAGTFHISTGNTGGLFDQGGTLRFVAGSSFDTVQLLAYDSSNNPVAFGIDNLSVSRAPAPSALHIALLGVVPAASLLLRRTRRIL